MITAAVVGLLVAAVTGTVAWHRRLPLRVRTVLVLATGLLLLGAFLVAAAAGDAQDVERLPVHVPLSSADAGGWLLVAWVAAAGGGPFAELTLRMARGRLFLEALRDGSWRRPDRDDGAPTAQDGDADPAATHGDATLEAEQVAAAQELRGGSMIGVLERLAVAGALLAGASSGLALVVAVKALGRYPELRSAGASERFIIGTLASLLWASAAAGTGRLLLLT